MASSAEFASQDDGYTTDDGFDDHGRVGSTDSPSTASAASVASHAELPWPGSVGHESGSCKPCAFALKGKCKNGFQCNHCHLHGPPRIKLRKRGIARRDWWCLYCGARAWKSRETCPRCGARRDFEGSFGALGVLVPEGSVEEEAKGTSFDANLEGSQVHDDGDDGGSKEGAGDFTAPLPEVPALPGAAPGAGFFDVELVGSQVHDGGDDGGLAEGAGDFTAPPALPEVPALPGAAPGAISNSGSTAASATCEAGWGFAESSHEKRWADVDGSD